MKDKHKTKFKKMKTKKKNANVIYRQIIKIFVYFQPDYLTKNVYKEQDQAFLKQGNKVIKQIQPILYKKNG